MKNLSIALAAVSSFIAVTAVAATARADQVANPAEYYIDAPGTVGATLYTTGGVTLDLSGSDVIDWYINADGSVTFYTSGFPMSDAGFTIGGSCSGRTRQTTSTTERRMTSPTG